jgi:hypothetical protein
MSEFDRELDRRAPTSYRQWARLCYAMHPATKAEAIVRYLHLLADPSGAPLTGVPSKFAYYAQFLRLRSKFRVVSDASGNWGLEVMDSYTPQYDFTDVNEYVRAITTGKLPFVDHTGATEQPILVSAINPATVPPKTHVLGATIPGGGSPLGGYSAYPPLGVTIGSGAYGEQAGAMGRLVALEVEFICDQNAFDRSGIAYVAQQTNTTTPSLNGKDLDTIFGLQGVEVSEVPLTEDVRAYVVRIPTRETEVNWVPMNMQGSAVAAPNVGFVNTLIATIMGENAKPSTAVGTVRVTYVLEVRNDIFAFGTYQPSADASGLAASMMEHMPHPAQPVGARGDIRAAHVARTLAEQEPTLLPHFAAHLEKNNEGGNWTSFLGRLADFVLPIVSDGIIPPGVGSAVAGFLEPEDTRVILHDPLSGAEPIRLDAPPRVQELPDDYGEPVALARSTITKK